MEATTTKLKQLLPHGSAAEIAKKFGISSSAVSQALKDSKPSSRIVQEALRIIRESGSLEAAQTLSALKAA